jgi:hypothetical protein
VLRDFPGASNETVGAWVRGLGLVFESLNVSKGGTAFVNFANAEAAAAAAKAMSEAEVVRPTFCEGGIPVRDLVSSVDPCLGRPQECSPTPRSSSSPRRPSPSTTSLLVAGWGRGGDGEHGR